MSVLQDVIFVSPDPALAANRAGDGTMAPGTTMWPGDLQFLVSWADNGTHSITANGGGAWTALTGSPFAGPGTEKLYIWRRICQSGDSAPTITVSGSTAVTSSHMALTFCIADGTFDTTTPIDVLGTGNSGTGTTATLASITTATAKAMLLSITGQGANSNTSNITQTGQTYIEQLDAGTTSGDDSRLAVSSSIKTAAGATSAGSIALGASNPWINVALAIRPRTLSGNTTHASWAAAMAADSPRNWWKFDDTSGTTAVDDGGTPTNGAYNGSPTLSATKVIENGVRAVTMDGVDDEMVVAVTAPNAFTLEEWIDDWTAGDVLCRDNTATNGCIFFWIGGTTLLSTRLGTGGDLASAIAPGSVRDGNRHHLLVQRQASVLHGNTRLWLDGKLVAAGQTTTSASNTSIHFGKNGTAAGFATYRQDDAALYTSTLTAAQVVAHYEAGLVAGSSVNHNSLSLLGVG